VRKLLNTLFILTEDSYLALENENVVVLNGEKNLVLFRCQSLRESFALVIKALLRL